MSTIDYAKARNLMVEQQVRPWDVLEPRVLQVLARLPREVFVAFEHRNLAYADLPLPLRHGEFMMKPVVEGRTLQALQLKPSDEVLEIGTGSGYLTACLAMLAHSVVSIERHTDLADSARERIGKQGMHNVSVVHADAFAYATDRRFDAICVTGAVASIPPRFLPWLKPNGRMFIVQGQSPAMDAVLLRAGNNGTPADQVESLFETDLPYLVGGAPVPAFSF